MSDNVFRRLRYLASGTLAGADDEESWIPEPYVPGVGTSDSWLWISMSNLGLQRLRFLDLGTLTDDQQSWIPET